MNDLFEAKFTIGQIADPSLVLAPTIRQWFGRGIWTIGENDQSPEKNGAGRRLSAATAVGLAITGGLTNAGLDPKSAAFAAKMFAYTGDENRAPCNLFADGSTIVFASDEYATIINDIGNGIKILPPKGGGKRSYLSGTILEVDDLVIRAIENLKLDRSLVWGGK